MAAAGAESDENRRQNKTSTHQMKLHTSAPPKKGGSDPLRGSSPPPFKTGSEITRLDAGVNGTSYVTGPSATVTDCRAIC